MTTGIRIIPCMLLRGSGFYKTTKFREPVYLGDPLNILKIFNEKEVDELAILDFSATRENREPDFPYLESLAGECFMPLAYGGGVVSIAQIKKLFQIGFEKVILNSAAIIRPELIKEAAEYFGSQSVVVCIDSRKSLLGGYRATYVSGTRDSGMSPMELAMKVEMLGAGEIIVNSTNRDGTMAGYDIDLIQKVTSVVKVPVVALGGAGQPDDFRMAVCVGKASACGAGAMFVFQGPHRAVLINVPNRSEIKAIIK